MVWGLIDLCLGFCWFAVRLVVLGCGVWFWLFVWL